jgi:ferredoxin
VPARAPSTEGAAANLATEPDIRRQGVAMKVVVDYDLCESNAVCMGIAPEVFEVRDDDNLYILQEEPPEELRPKIEEAVRMCPKQAISLVEE